MARSLSVSALSGSSRNRGVLLVAGLCAAISAALMFAFLSSRGGDGSDIDKALTSAGGAESVVVVARDIPAGEKITEDMLRVQPVPTSALLTGRHTTTSDLVGKVATAPLYTGEQVIDSKVTTFAGQNTLAYKVPDGMRALSVQIPHEAWANAGLVQPGDRVDVLGVTTTSRVDPLTGEERPNVVGWYIAQDVEVLAFAQTTVKVIPNIDGKPVTIQSSGTNNSTTSTTPVAGTTPGASTTGTTNGAQVTDPKAKPGDEADHYETAISITLALPPDIAAQVMIIDAMKDDVGQYRIVTRQKGDTTRLTGETQWTFDDMFSNK